MPEGSDELRCNVCGEPAIGVAASPLGAISSAMCRECLELGRQPWHVLIGCLMGCERGEVAEWVLPIIEATLTFYNKTEDEMWDEVQLAVDEYEECMAEEEA